MSAYTPFVLKMYKVYIPGERFWINMLSENDEYVLGIISNCLITTEQFAYGDLVKWDKDMQELSRVDYSKCAMELINHLDDESIV